ncbi:ribosome biogenesis GTPase Der [Candidatus Dependentiae bacterium]|nr:ribosome biogenesis GTPase Der [Candidatus Dependentiae bacterium]
MKKIKKYPKVIIVGRTNVGKSTLFNRISKSTKSIVLEEEGVTRDYLSEIISWNKKTFELIDTGGVSFKKEKDPILEEIRLKVIDLLNKASLILFVCDGKNGLTQEDRIIAKTLHKTKKPVYLVINKSDNKLALEENLPEFYSLGFKELIEISALHGKGIIDLLDKITKNLPKPREDYFEEKESYKIAIIGKPNVGKSSLTNLLINEERSIVSQVAGTTREAISNKTFVNEDLVLITDTAGVRKKKKVKEDIENLMVKSTLSTIRTSNIILIVIDAKEEKLSDQELKLLFYAYEQKKAIILVINKTDLIEVEQRAYLEHNLSEYDFILKKIPIVWISCKDKKNISKIYKQIQKLWERLNQTFDDEEIDELIKLELTKKPLFHKRQQLKVKQIKSVKDTKIPTFKLKTNYPEWFGESQLGFIENILRKNYDLLGCPIKFILQKK